MRLVRIVAIILLLSAAATAAGLLLMTSQGRTLLSHPHDMRTTVTGFVQQHRLVAPILFVIIYAMLGTLALPVWWLQTIGGMAFGLVGGVAYAQIGSTIGAVVSARFAHWLAADWMHRVEERLEKLRSLDETFGHNGLLVVMAVRLTHVLPFGLSNYAFGLTTMRPRDIAWGTLLGGIPAAAVYTGIGVGDHPLRDVRYIAGIVILNVLLLVPLVVQYFWKRT